MILQNDGTSSLERESRFLGMLTQLITRHADVLPVTHPVGREHSSVKRTREYIEAYHHKNLSLGQLSEVANLSPFHFIRVFQREVGLAPHAYLNQTRVRKAKELLSKGWDIAAVAYQTGFVDQSHLTRHFKRIVGVTPGHFRNFVQDRLLRNL